MNQRIARGSDLDLEALPHTWRLNSQYRKCYTALLLCAYLLLLSPGWYHAFTLLLHFQMITLRRSTVVFNSLTVRLSLPRSLIRDD